MNKLFLFLLVVLSLSVYGFAIEEANLSPAYTFDPRISTVFKVEMLKLDWSNQTIKVQVGDGTKSAVFTYTGSTATTLMNALNKANLTNNSLHKRILNQLITDGFISGSVSGSPD